jgi:hypothetical protein
MYSIEFEKKLELTSKGARQPCTRMEGVCTYIMENDTAPHWILVLRGILADLDSHLANESSTGFETEQVLPGLKKPRRASKKRSHIE